ncbi:N-succinylarginine dihydrolase [Roseimaritima ulvae]|uniref:N-succinylarginine dihydrolase n=1 Tax=Roseimaritima ulvae TaxID=980254 RepID=A0A5B9QHS8_9BACT|nr:N-succinylarginine dihydrolase [Roseimaritima ulvae]QEG38404.1 N-succinylarginine dihydrolase [Roseimaritima ulvae]
MTLQEVNFDGLVGPTHHFGGLGVGNLASQSHGGQVARPRAAALQGIGKMRLVASLGAFQYVLPPQQRPDLSFLQQLGFEGSPQQVLSAAAADSPAMLSAAYSASAMWTANAATVTAASDSHDGRVHLSVANLTSSIHRSLEPSQTLQLLRRVFPHPDIVVHPPLPPTWGLRDEGAANHMRLWSRGAEQGIELFVYGGKHHDPNAADGRFPARQSFPASRALVRRHTSRNALLLQQHPMAIAAGAFHNDVVATSCRNVLLLHEYSFADPDAIDRVSEHYRQVCGAALHVDRVRNAELSLEDTIATYLFNSQLIVDNRDPDGPMTIVCPQQVAESAAARKVVERWLEDDGPVNKVVYVELRESMNNGGGPACLRLRVPMDESQRQSLPSGLQFDDALAERLERVIERTYPEQLGLDDLASADVLQQVTQAQQAVWDVLGA